ncbi:hypothetical protein QR680_012329 [Steinernema hermaphroditum]|uniref:non-specific serine/threonine protein kinase n=1 Tax=Steinernema hermaphroditum TaxID=289476 RepID=A0AA39M0C5_9BILA|nr:hypothetical protein QR680_012329 [Steinernema hermaphroditum]
MGFCRALWDDLSVRTSSGTKRKSTEAPTDSGKKMKLTPKSPREETDYPVKLHDFVRERFFVLRKAGCGSFAAVWICWDVERRQFVALKISKHTKEVLEATWTEVEIYKHLQKKVPLRRNIVALHEWFQLRHDGHTHVCLVFELMGMNLQQRIRTNKTGFTAFDVQRILTDVLGGLRILHENNIVHTDLKPENILTGISVQDELELTDRTIVAMKKMQGTDRFLGALRKHERRLSRGGEKREVVIKVADLGSAQFLKEHLIYDYMVTTQPYRSFEVLMRDEWTTSTDIWSVGCVAYELATAKMLLPVVDEDERLHLNWMISRLGMPRSELRHSGRHARVHFDARGGRVDDSHINSYKVKPEKIMVHNRVGFSAKKAELLCDFIWRTLDFDKMKRPSSAACLQHPFIANPFR